MEHWLAIVIGIYLMGMILYGHYRGFIRLAVSLGTLVLTLISVKIAMPYVTGFLKENTAIQQSLENGMKEAVGIDGSNITEAELPAAQREFIENLKIPDQLKTSLIENNNAEVYRLLGVNKFVEYVSRFLADRVINALGFAILFIALYVVLRVIIRWLNLISHLPIINGVNKIAGAVLGGIEGLLCLWIVFLILPAFSSTDLGMMLMNQIAQSSWLSFLYHNNFLGLMASGIITGMF